MQDDARSPLRNLVVEEERQADEHVSCEPPLVSQECNLEPHAPEVPLPDPCCETQVMLGNAETETVMVTVMVIPLLMGPEI